MRTSTSPTQYYIPCFIHGGSVLGRKVIKSLNGERLQGPHDDYGDLGGLSHASVTPRIG